LLDAAVLILKRFDLQDVVLVYYPGIAKLLTLEDCAFGQQAVNVVDVIAQNLGGFFNCDFLVHNLSSQVYC